MGAHKLSKRQRSMLEMIRAHLEENGRPPTIREIGDEVGISSTSVVSYNLDVLQRKGFLVREADISRGLRLVEDDEPSSTRSAQGPGTLSSLVTIPLLGTIAAGEPIPVPDSDFAPADYEQIPVDADVVASSEQVYALRVRGTSMIDALNWLAGTVR